MSQCSTCGTACVSSRVIDRNNLDYYISRNCSILFGSLHLSSIGSVYEGELELAFASVRIIRGDLIITDNPTIATLNAFRGLTKVGNIVIDNNNWLVDARLPSIVSTGAITIGWNPRLCPSLSPGNMTSVDRLNCAQLNITQLVALSSSLSTSSIVSVVAAYVSDSLFVNSSNVGHEHDSICSISLICRF